MRLLLAAVAGLSACAAPPAADEASWPIDAVPVTIEGRGPYALGFDTGQSVPVLLSTALARELALAPQELIPVGDGSGANGETAQLYRIAELRIGAETFRDVVAIAFDARHGPENGPGRGALGFPLFADRLLTVAGDRIELRRGELPPPDGATILAYAAPRELPLIQIDLAGRRMSALLDSGNPAFLSLPLRLADELPLHGEPRVVGRASTLFNEFDVLAAELAGDLAIGAYVFPAPTLELNEVLPEANVGRGLTGRFRVTFDQRNRRVRLVPREAPDPYPL